MRKSFKYLVAAIAGVMAMMTSCHKEDAFLGTEDKGGAVSIDINICVPGMSQVSTKAVDPDGGGVQNITLFCFDQYGLFVSTISAEVTPKTTGISLEGSFKAEIPDHVKTVHLVGNQNLSYFAQGDYAGKSEVEIITSIHASAGRMIYWARRSVSELVPGTTVQLLRNQARVSVSIEDDVNFEQKGWVVVNTNAFGTIAPYNNEMGGFVAPTIDAPFVTHPMDETRLNSYYDVRVAQDEYYFETENSHENPVDMIIKGSQDGGEDLYYRISMLDKDGEPLLMMRNHHYIFNIAGKLSFGQKTFAEALTASATNNVWVSVSDDVRKVFDKERTLEVDQTYVVVGEEQIDNPNTYNLYYTVSRVNSLGSQVPLTQDDKPEVYWLDGNNVAQHLFTHNFTPSTGRGQLIISFLPMGDLQKREGTLVVKYGKLYRKIKVITVKEQEFVPAWITTNIYGQEKGEDVTMMFTIPETCPEELFPMDVLLSVNDMDIRSESGMMLPTIMAGSEGYGEDNGIGYKYKLTVERAGMQRVYLQTSLKHAVTDQVHVTVEAEHFKSLTKTATFQTATSSRILIHNLRTYVGAMPADEYIYYYLVPQKINAAVEFNTYLGREVENAPQAGKGVTLTNPLGEQTHFEYIAPNLDFNPEGGYNVDEFLLYSQNLEHNHDKPAGTTFFFDVYKDQNPANWSATAGRVLGFIRNTNGTPGSGASFHFKTNKAKSDEVVRIASNVKGAPSITSGTKGSLVVMDFAPADGKCTGEGLYRSCVFELVTFDEFKFAAQINNEGTIVPVGTPEEVDQITFSYKPGAEVDIDFDVTSYTSSIKGTTGAVLPSDQQVSVDPFGTEFKIYIDAPMLEIDQARNVLPQSKFYYDEALQCFVYVVDADRETERMKTSGVLWADAWNGDMASVDYLGNALSADKQSGERKSLPFKTKSIVSEGKIVIRSQEDVVVFDSKTFNVTNELISGSLKYGTPGNEKAVPADSFVPFEMLPTYNRIGVMTVGASGQYQLHLRSEYKYNWDTDDVKLQYVDEGGTIYEAQFDSLDELYSQKDILLTPKS